MRRTILIAVVALLAVASPAEAAHHNRQVVSLRHKLHNMTILRNQARAQVASQQAQIGALQQQVAELQGALAQSHQQTAQAQQRANALQNQINSVPSPLSVAVARVHEAATWAGGGGEATSEAAMEYTIGHVSLADYGYLEDFKYPLPPTTEGVNAILAGGAGYCGHSSRVFGAIMVALGYPVRGVWFTYNDPLPAGHYAVEVYYDGDWHFFDPTFGKFWLDASGNVESIANVRANGGTLVKDNTALVNIVEDQWLPSGDYSWFETDPSTQVEYQPQSSFVS